MSTIRSALGVAVAAHVPTILWGGPGLGKTSAVREMADRAALPCEVVVASIREPSDFAGLPVVEPTGTGVVFAAPAWARRLAEVDDGLVFLDEISTAPPAVQAALLRVVLERVVGDLSLPAGIRVVAAANAPEDAADGWDLAPALANRFCHLDWRLEAREWADGIVGGFDPAVIPPLDPDELGRQLAGVRGTVGAFVSTRPAMLYAPPNDESTAGRAWPSPRTWDMAARLIAASRMAGSATAVTATLTAGAIGAAAASEFLAWQADLELPDPEAVLLDPESLRLPDRGDRAFAVLASLTNAVLARNTPQRWEAAWRAIASGTSKGKSDLAIAAVRSLVNNRPDGARPPAEVLRTMAPLLREAGILDRLLSGDD